MHRQGEPAEATADAREAAVRAHCQRDRQRPRGRDGHLVPGRLRRDLRRAHGRRARSDRRARLALPGLERRLQRNRNLRPRHGRKSPGGSGLRPEGRPARRDRTDDRPGRRRRHRGREHERHARLPVLLERRALDRRALPRRARQRGRPRRNRNPLRPAERRVVSRGRRTCFPPERRIPDAARADLVPALPPPLADRGRDRELGRHARRGDGRGRRGGDPRLGRVLQLTRRRHECRIRRSALPGHPRPSADGRRGAPVGCGDRRRRDAERGRTRRS